MAKIIDLTIQSRNDEGTGAAKRLRKSGSIPAVIYGRNKENINVQVNAKIMGKILENSASDNLLVTLKLGDKDQLALVQEAQHDHLRGGLIHVDFHAINKDEEIHAEVPVEIIGEAEGARLGGLVEAIHHSIEVRCLPFDLPDHITIDVTNLKVGQGIHVKEIQFPKGVRAKLDGDVVIIMCEEPRVEETPVEAAPAADAKPAAKKAAKK